MRDHAQSGTNQAKNEASVQSTARTSPREMRSRASAPRRRNWANVEPPIGPKNVAANRAAVEGRGPPWCASPSAARGSVYVHDLDDRSLVFVCRRDGAELVVVTLWEREDGVAQPRVPRRYTDELRRP